MATKTKKKKSVRTPFWNEYYHTVRKPRMKLGRPVKDCVACGLPIIDPPKYKANVHVSTIPGMRSDCTKKRDSDYKKEQKRLGNIEVIKKPKGLRDKYNIQKVRSCLKCNDDFPSQSLHNRVCENCKTRQPDIMNFGKLSLETESITELYEFSPYS